MKNIYFLRRKLTSFSKKFFTWIRFMFFKIVKFTIKSFFIKKNWKNNWYFTKQIKLYITMIIFRRNEKLILNEWRIFIKKFFNFLKMNLNSFDQYSIFIQDSNLSYLNSRQFKNIILSQKIQNQLHLQHILI